LASGAPVPSPTACPATAGISTDGGKPKSYARKTLVLKENNQINPIATTLKNAFQFN